MWQVGLRISWLTQGLPTLSWPPTLEASPSKPVPFWVLQEKQLQKDSPKHFFVPGMDKSFPTSFWWPLRVLLPHWEVIFPCLQNPAAIAVLKEDVWKLSFGGKLFLPPTKWNNSWMGEVIIDVRSMNPQISNSTDGKSKQNKKKQNKKTTGQY